MLVVGATSFEDVARIVLVVGATSFEDVARIVLVVEILPIKIPITCDTKA